MSLFYYDDYIEQLEQQFLWDKSLAYLERIYSLNQEISKLNSLIGFAWFYEIEGPIISKKYGNDPNKNALAIWKKYIDLGNKIAADDPTQLFISGYTLSLHGFFISGEYERKGLDYMRKCQAITDNPMLKQLADNFLLNRNSRKYKHIEKGSDICQKLFDGQSLLDEYFREIYGECALCKLY